MLKKVLAVTGGNLTPALSMDGVASKFSSHPSVAWLQQFGGNLRLGISQSLSVPDKKNADAGKDVKTLMETGSRDWGETDMKSIDTKNPEFNAGADHAGPLVLGVAIDGGAVGGGGVSLDGTRVVAVGASDFLINKSIDSTQADFFLNAMNWLVGQTHALGISPKVPKEFNVTLSESQISQITLIIFFGFPAAALAIGVLVWFRRRK